MPETNLFKDDNGWKKGSDNSATSGSKSGESFTQQIFVILYPWPDRQRMRAA